MIEDAWLHEDPLDGFLDNFLMVFGDISLNLK